MHRQLFGASLAQDDLLLKECFVPPKESTGKPIVIGRWGVGKTALLIRENWKLAEELERYSPDDKNLWYIGELSLEPQLLIDIRGSLGQDNERFKRVLEEVWTAEITRTLSLMLWKLHDYYGSPQGDHWSAIIRFARSQSGVVPFLSRTAPKVLGAITGDEARVRYTQELLKEVETISRGTALQQLERCLRDVAVQSGKAQPVLVVEPLDTPASKLEDSPLAVPVVTALLNAFYRHFRPREGEPVCLRISIPWHRYACEDLDFPQRFPDYVGRIKWDPGTLKNFINARIAWEFNRVKRSGWGKDPWNALFGNYVTNQYCSPPVHEDCFQYFLRHTHYRPRDLIRLARAAVEEEAKKDERPVDDVLLGRRGSSVISESSIREAIRMTCHWLMVEEFFVEIGRKWSRDMAQNFTELLRRISVPFPTDELKSRVRRITLQDVAVSDLNNLISNLWESGIIGVEICTKEEKAIPRLREFLGRQTFRQFISGQRRLYRWYFFNYSWHRGPMELIEAYKDSKETEAGWVLHPSTFELLNPNISQECPIGA